REKKKRGRRAEQKGKRKWEPDDIDVDADDQYRSSKRHKAQNDDNDNDNSDPAPALPLPSTEEFDNYGDAAPVNRPPGPGDAPFVGLLDEEEQEYFKRADDMLELNQFEGPDERSLFLANVYREADGKELKLANSQSCSRLLERLILLSTPDQLKNLFQKFSGQ
ncbi:MAG: hypothetical protein INR71_14535, partial [Terriglobus roseus]|nr:hypothetical protein [Terriglobus roseus]